MKSPDTAALHARVQGRVQGVGFRYSALREAERYDLSGWVKNTADGEVEVWVEGHPDNIAQFAVWLRQGPRSAHVMRVIKEKVGPRGYTELRVEY
ncbi:MAG: acylphosphatase [Treponema sp.]|nr:acylphosphatase [Treponema sp.]